MPTCTFYLHDICTKPNCPYRHVKVTEDASPCIEFQNGFCPLGLSCPNIHTYNSVLEEAPSQDMQDGGYSFEIDRVATDFIPLPSFPPQIVNRSTFESYAELGSENCSEGDEEENEDYEECEEDNNDDINDGEGAVNDVKGIDDAESYDDDEESGDEDKNKYEEGNDNEKVLAPFETKNKRKIGEGTPKDFETPDIPRIRRWRSV